MNVRRPEHKRAACLIAIAMLVGATTVRATDWPQFGFDARHSGNNTAEHAIDRAHVPFLYGQYRVPVVAPLTTDAAPVYASAIETASGTKDLLFINASDGGADFGSTTGFLIAIDAADGSIVWVQTTSGSSAHASSSPAIDPGREYVYAYGLDGCVHRYRIGDGVETLTPGPVGWPALVTLKPDVEKVAGGLTIVERGGNAYVVAVTDGYNGDGGDYQGHVTTIDLATGVQHVFNAMCSDVTTHLARGACADARSGIWGRGGATFDATTDRMYVATGNGRFDANAGGYDWGDSVFALVPDGSSAGGMPIDSYTPANYEDLDVSDQDLGLTSLAILPTPEGSNVAHLGFQIGKEGIGYLIDLDNMSGTSQPAGVGGELQELFLGAGDTMSQPAVWTDPDDGSTWMFTSGTAWQLVLDGSGTPSLEIRWGPGPAGGIPIIADDVLYWSNGLIAVDPRTGDPLWFSGGGGSSHWQSPIIVDGSVYFADSDGYLSKWTLPVTYVVTPVVSDPAAGTIDPAEPQVVAEGNSTRFTVAPIPPYAIASVSGCGVYFDGEFYETSWIYADCTVTAVFVVDPIFASGFDGVHGAVRPNAPTSREGAPASPPRRSP